MSLLENSSRRNLNLSFIVRNLANGLRTTPDSAITTSLSSDAGPSTTAVSVLSSSNPTSKTDASVSSWTSGLWPVTTSLSTCGLLSSEGITSLMKRRSAGSGSSESVSSPESKTTSSTASSNREADSATSKHLPIARLTILPR